jgi:acetylornithine deacetylase/succinyl-diaminopimelate desuccinylase-like protein
MDDQAEDLGRFARQYTPRVVTFLQDLVRIPSVNGQDPEAAVAQRIVQEAEALDLPVQLVAKEGDRPNVVVRWGTGAPGFALIGHMDTVAPGEAGWSHPPFGAELVEGRLYGRGAADNKAGLACGLYTLAILAELELLDPGAASVFLAGVVDEESGASSPLGVRYLLNQGKLPVQGAIYTYTSDIVCQGHRGLIRLELLAEGQSTHTGSDTWSQGEGGVNAVTGLAVVLIALEKLHLPTEGLPAFPGLSPTITPGTLFHGGEFESIVPATAQATVDIRLLPGQDSETVLGLVQEIIDAEASRRPGLRITVKVKNDLPGAFIPSDHPLVRTAQEHTQIHTGRTWPVALAGPANEGYMLIEAGIPTLCGFGPTGGGAHAPDEWVAVDSLAPTMAMYAGIIHDYLITS